MHIKCKLTDGLTTFKNLHFCGKFYKKDIKLKYEVTIGLGGNVGDVKRRFEHLFIFFKRDKRVEIIKSSLILKNPPFGYLLQDDFLNSVMILRTNMQPIVFLDYLLRVEKKFGRKRSFDNAPRTLDLDIIFFDKKIINKKRLKVPHPSWSKRESVVIPLMDINR